mgnify:CR=1 FL=1
MNAPFRPLRIRVRLADPGDRGAVALDQFDLQVVQRVEIGEAVLDRARQQRIAGQAFLGAGDGREHAAGTFMLAGDAAEDGGAQLAVRHQSGVARGHGEVGLGEHHVHVRQQGGEERPFLAHGAQGGQTLCALLGVAGFFQPAGQRWRRIELGCDLVMHSTTKYFGGHSDILGGALFTSFLFMLGKYGISVYLSQNMTASSYGAAGSIIILLAWVYYSSAILYFGAEFTKEYAIKYGKGIQPSSFAVLVKQTELEIDPETGIREVVKKHNDPVQ